MRKALLAVCAVLALPVVAAEGRIQISSPGVLSVPGRYVVTRNLSGAGTILQVTASDVDIDLNGFTLTSTGVTNAVIQASLVSNVSVRRGTVRGGLHSISAFLALDFVIEDVHTYSAAGDGAHLPGVHGVVIRRSVFENHGSRGIYLDGGPGSPFKAAVIEENSIRECGGGILIVNTDGVSVRDNRIGPTSIYAGLEVDNGVEPGTGARISDNTIVETAAEGMTMDVSAAIVTGNSVAAAGGDGIVVDGSGNLLLNNIVDSAAGNGMRIEADKDHIAGNLLSNNGDFGLHLVGNNNVYRENTARGNVAGTCAGASTTDFCNAGTGNSSAVDNFLPSLQ